MLEETNLPTQPESGPAKKKTWLIILIAAVALFLLGCLCALVVIVLLGPTIGNTFSNIIQTVP